MAEREEQKGSAGTVQTRGTPTVLPYLTRGVPNAEDSKVFIASLARDIENGAILMRKWVPESGKPTQPLEIPEGRTLNLYECVFTTQTGQKDSFVLGFQNNYQPSKH